MVIFWLVLALTIPLAAFFFFGGESTFTFLDGHGVWMDILNILVLATLIAGIVCYHVGFTRQATSLRRLGLCCLLLFIASPWIFFCYLQSYMSKQGYHYSMDGTTVTNSHYYQRFKRDWKPEVTAQFPDAIPPEATQVQFIYCSGKNSMLQLRYQLPPQEIATLPATYAPLVKKKYWYNNGDITRWDVPHFKPLPGDIQENYNDSSFPIDYEIMELYADASDASGVAISKTQNEVLYWIVHKPFGVR